MQRNDVLVTFLSMFILAGCDTMYVQPESGPMANLRVIAGNSEDYFALSRDVTNVCSRNSPNFTMVGGGSKADAENVGMPEYLGPRNDRFERKIKAETPLRVWTSTMRRVGAGEVLAQTTSIGVAVSQSRMWSCSVVVEFIPKAGSNYEILNNFSSGTCPVEVNEIMRKDGQIIRIPVEAKIYGGPEERNICSLMTYPTSKQ